MQRYFAKNIIKDTIILDSKDLHHIKNVMRMQKEDKVEVVKNNEVYLCEILENYEIKIVNKIPNIKKETPQIILAVALIKEQKQDLVLQKATELGVDIIIPLSLSRCVVKLDKEKFSKKKPRWETICKEASEQSKRNNIPIITPIHTIQELSQIDATLKIVLDTKEFYQSIKNVLHNHPNCAKIIIVIGPEGGITKEEISFLKNNGYQSVSLGPNILRAETAAIAVLSMINYQYMR